MHAEARAGIASRLALACVAAAGLSLATRVAAQPPADVEASAIAAAARAVRDVFGADAEVELGAPVLSLLPAVRVVAAAVPEPSSRTGGPVRFVLYADADATKRVGRLTARVDVRASHVRVTRKVAARAVLGDADVAVVKDAVGRQPLAPLPTLDAARGATTRASLAAGDVVTTIALVPRRLVTSGDEIVTVARVGSLEVRGRAVAAQSGGLGDTVVVVNPDSRRRLRGRVIADALVEVLHGS